MIELKKRVNEIIDNLNRDWTNAIKEGEENGIDMTEMFSKYSQHQKDLDLAFTEASLRKQGKKGWF